MNWIGKFKRWRYLRRLAAHQRRLKRSKVLMPEPDPHCKRATPECEGTIR